jgi:transcriptional regulator with XRE-family HTH domain
MLIQKLRLKQGWSQQQLADASGLSARTIQRIEAGQPASTETLKSLAAVFEVEFSTLQSEPTMTAIASTTTDKQEEEAFQYVRKLRGFYLHLMQYVLVVNVMLAINLILSPQKMWVYWVMGGWGLGVLMHAARVFKSDWLLGPQWERRQVEKRLGRQLW